LPYNPIHKFILEAILESSSHNSVRKAISEPTVSMVGKCFLISVLNTNDHCRAGKFQEMDPNLPSPWKGNGGIYDIPQEFIHESDYLSSAKIVTLVIFIFTTAEGIFC